MSNLFLERLSARFWKRVDKTPGLGPNGDCWEWRGGRSVGYGSIRVTIAAHVNKGMHAHRVAFWLANVREAAGLVCHSCDNRLCVNPAHLSEGTHSSNIKEAWDRNRRVARKPQFTTHCRIGHALVGDNVYVTKNGHRRCQMCKKALWHSWTLRNRRRSA